MHASRPACGHVGHSLGLTAAATRNTSFFGLGGFTSDLHSKRLPQVHAAGAGGIGGGEDGTKFEP